MHNVGDVAQRRHQVRVPARPAAVAAKTAVMAMTMVIPTAAEGPVEGQAVMVPRLEVHQPQRRRRATAPVISAAAAVGRTRPGPSQQARQLVPAVLVVPWRLSPN